MKRVLMILTGVCFFMQISAQNTVKEKDPGVAWLMSLVVPGAGQFYNGQYVKGGIMMGVWAGCVTSIAVGAYRSNHNNRDNYECDHENGGLILTGMFFYLIDELWSTIDAPISANRINKKNRLMSWQIGKNSRLSMKPDMCMTTQTFSGNHMLTPAYGAKLSLTF